MPVAKTEGTQLETVGRGEVPGDGAQTKGSNATHRHFKAERHHDQQVTDVAGGWVAVVVPKGRCLQKEDSETVEPLQHRS